MEGKRQRVSERQRERERDAGFLLFLKRKESYLRTLSNLNVNKFSFPNGDFFCIKDAKI